MNSVLKISAITLISLAFTACATTPTETLTIQNMNNEYEVSGLGKTQVLAKNNAIAAANKTCGKNTTPILINEKSEYNGALKGVVDDETGKLITAASSVIGSVLGKTNPLEKDSGYQTTIKFKCNANR